MFSLRAFTVIFLALITGATLGAGITVWMMRESSLGERFGFVSTETAATLLAAQKKTMENAPDPESDPESRLSQMLADRSSSADIDNETIKTMALRIDDLTSQHAALSRDLESLRFRVDTHSKSFRPLQSDDLEEESRLRPLGK